MSGNTVLLISKFIGLMQNKRDLEAYQVLQEIDYINQKDIDNIVKSFAGNHGLGINDHPETELDRLNVPFVDIDDKQLQRPESLARLQEQFIEKMRLLGNLQAISSTRLSEGNFKQIPSETNFIIRGSSGANEGRYPYSISSSQKVIVDFTNQTAYEAQSRIVTNLHFVFFPSFLGKNFLRTECTADAQVDKQGRMKLLSSPYMCRVYT